MTPLHTSAFALPDRLRAKADPALIARDERHFAAVSRSIERTLADLTERLDDLRRAPARMGQEVLERDLETQRLAGRVRALRRFGIDLCLGRMVREGDPEPVYVGRLGLVDADGSRLLLDWRSPAAEPFFGATHANPMGLASRRRYRWTGMHVTDYWDEVFSAEGLEQHAALDDQSAFIASLGERRSERMRDVLGTIQADQDAIIRAGSRGALVVDGGPGTGKTVVALHRTAYLLYADPRLGHHRGGVLFLGPSRPYLSYVADVLPRLGEEGVATCTLRDLVPEGAAAGEEADADVARLKASRRLVEVVERAVAFYEEGPTEGFEVDSGRAQVWVSPGDWEEAFRAPDPGMPHNEAREEVWAQLLTILVDKHDVDEDPVDGVPAEQVAEQVRDALARDEELLAALNRAWPVIEPTDLVADLWTVPVYLRLCAPWLTPDEVRLLRRADGAAWTVADLPWLDAARQRLGDPSAFLRARHTEAAVAARREEMDRVVDHLIATDDSEMHLMSMLRGPDLQAALIDADGLPAAGPDGLAGPFAHVVVDEAQELTDAEWQMVLARCPSRSLTVVGDRAQARHGFAETWAGRLERVGLDRITVATLTVNYRTPAEVMAVAEPVIRAALPDASVPTSVRSTGISVRYAGLAERDAILAAWLAEHDEGLACVIGDPTFEEEPRIRSLTPVTAKGLEFDLVVLVDPSAFGAGIEGAVDRYVAMTRATGQLVVLTS